MAIGQQKDVENGEIVYSLEALEEPFIQADKIVSYEDDETEESGSISMVLLCTFVAVCGSFEFGSCVGYSAPTQSAIREDLNLSLAEADRLQTSSVAKGNADFGTLAQNLLN